MISSLSAVNVASFSLAVSILALVVTTLSLFQQHLKPFTLIGTAGGFTILPDRPGAESNTASLYVPILLRNLGARSGTVSDFIVQVEHRGSTAVCEPIGVFDYKKWIDAAVKKKPNYESIQGFFVPPVIGGRESQLLHLLFTCDRMGDILGWLAQGDVSFRLLARIEKEERYVTLVERTEDAAQPDIVSKLRGGQAIGMLDPSNNALRKKMASGAQAKR